MEFLLYIKFEKVFALVGGIRSLSFKMDNEIVETQDFERHFRIFIPSSGVKSMDIEFNGILDFQQGPEMFGRIWSLYKDSTPFQARLDSEGLTRIAGTFMFQALEGTSQANMANEIAGKIVSSGEFTMEALNAP